MLYNYSILEKNTSNKSIKAKHYIDIHALNEGK